MDTNSIYEGYRSRENNSKIIEKSFYTEKIKDSNQQDTILKKIKSILMRKLL